MIDESYWQYEVFPDSCHILFVITSIGKWISLGQFSDQAWKIKKTYPENNSCIFSKKTATKTIFLCFAKKNIYALKLFYIKTLKRFTLKTF